VTSGTEFGAALREWRTRRRLSQLDLSLLAGTTQRHLSFLEQGRSAPGRGVVIRLASSLDLTLRDQNALLLAAGFAPLYGETDPQAPVLASVLSALQHVLNGHLPYPAMVMGRYGILVAANEAFSILTDGAAPELLESPVNVLRLALHPDGMAPRILNLEEWADHILGRLRLRAAHSPDPKIWELIDELVSYLPPGVEKNAHSLGFAVPLHFRSTEGDLRLIATLMTFAMARDLTLADLTLEGFLPSDPATMEILTQRHRA
jgi:transcriptional regulator with XRE-family HTH domain